MPDPYKIISTDIKAEYQPLPKADMANVLLPVLYTYSCFLSQILEQEFFCLGRLGSPGSKGKKWI